MGVICVKLTRKCSGCKEEFRKDDMVQYFSITGQTSQWLCRNCYSKKIENEKFSNRICAIFGIKSPGPIIWSQRKMLQETYGYTDDLILDCLDYAYNVKKIKKLSESLYFVKPNIIEEMKRWKRQQKEQASGIAAAIKITTENKPQERIVEIKERKKERKETNLEDGLFDD